MNAENSQDGLCWYVVQTHPRQEERAAQNLTAHSVETFAPQFRARRCNEFTGKPTYFNKPLFPRYIFVRFRSDDLYHKVKFTRGVNNIVCFNDGPAPVDDEIIAILRSRVKDDGFVKMDENLKPGDEVVVIDGPFRNFGGVFLRETADNHRVSILLQAVNYKVEAILGREILRKVS